MSTYSLVTEQRGQTLDEFWFDSAECLLAKLAAMGLRADTVGGTQFHGDDYVAHHGAWPGGAATGSEIRCAWCQGFMWRGPAAT